MAVATARLSRSQCSSACSSVIARSESSTRLRSMPSPTARGAYLAIRQIAVLECFFDGWQIEQGVGDAKNAGRLRLVRPPHVLCSPFGRAARHGGALAWLPIGAVQVELAQLDEEMGRVARDRAMTVDQVCPPRIGGFRFHRACSCLLPPRATCVVPLANRNAVDARWRWITVIISSKRGPSTTH